MSSCGAPTCVRRDDRKSENHLTVSALSRVGDGLPMTVRGGGVPALVVAFMPRERMGPPPRSFATDAHGLHHGLGLELTGYKVAARLIRARKRAPLRSSSRPHQACRRAQRCQGQAFGGRHEATSPDISCARRLSRRADRGEETDTGSNKETDDEKMVDTESPIQGERKRTVSEVSKGD